jgi:hypothetical protein
MHNKLTASAVTGFLLLGAAGVAMAQEPPPDEFQPIVSSAFRQPQTSWSTRPS